MKSLVSVLLTFAVAVLSSVEASNYCESSLCPAGTSHVACKNNGGFSSTCPKGARMIDLAPHIRTIVNSHNTKRNLIASGELSEYQTAQRMATIEWDKELALIAAFNVKQCAIKHDECHNTADFKNSGQNIGSFGYSGSESGYTDEWIVKNRINAWWAENEDCKMKFMDKYPRKYKGPIIGHFTVMATESNTRVGCAAARYLDGNFNRFLMTCNYARTNIIERAVYTSGKPASGCTKGKNPKFSSLCATSEVYSGFI